MYSSVPLIVITKASPDASAGLEIVPCTTGQLALHAVDPTATHVPATVAVLAFLNQRA